MPTCDSDTTGLKLTPAVEFKKLQAGSDNKDSLGSISPVPLQLVDTLTL